MIKTSVVNGRVAEVGSLSASTEMAIQIFVWRVFAIFAINAYNNKFANLIQYNMQYITCDSAPLAQETLFLTPKKKTFFCPKSSKFA